MSKARSSSAATSSPIYNTTRFSRRSLISTQGRRRPSWGSPGDALQDQRQLVRVLALIAEDASRPGESAHKRDARELERAGRLKQRLAWLTPRVVIKDPLREM